MVPCARIIGRRPELGRSTRHNLMQPKATDAQKQTQDIRAQLLGAVRRADDINTKADLLKTDAAEKTRFTYCSYMSFGPSRLQKIPNSRHTSLMPSPSSKRATNRRRSSITELSFHGINTSRQMATSVTHVSGANRHLCLGSFTALLWSPLCRCEIVSTFRGFSAD